ncbi:hypothetical protein BES34_014860 [Leptospira inadai serovar Lyme]|uniref:Lipoprotein n=2 Tax=Leptospira inadai TaxID=29506 RepID=A0ABX4YFV9_9LEPT|nr:hypothetical protein BES34_014860 [Leptospira inadai serovar Lyme]
MKSTMNVRITFVFIVSILVLTAIPACGIFDKVDPDFKDDIMNGPENFQFDPNNVPILGVTTEEDLKKMYPPPSRKWTYKKPIPKEIMGARFNMDRVISYYHFQKDQISGPGKSGYVGKDYLYFNIFLEKGIVKQYLVKHDIKIKGKWVPSKDSKSPQNLSNNDLWPDQLIDGQCYWLQRKDRLYYLNSDSFMECPYWKAVPAWEK